MSWLAANTGELRHYPEISGRAHICHATFFFSLHLISCLGSLTRDLKWQDVGVLVHLQSQAPGVAMIVQWVNVKLFMHFLLMGRVFTVFFTFISNGLVGPLPRIPSVRTMFTRLC